MPYFFNYLLWNVFKKTLENGKLLVCIIKNIFLKKNLELIYGNKNF